LERFGRSMNEKVSLASNAAPAFDASRMAVDQRIGVPDASAVNPQITEREGGKPGGCEGATRSNTVVLLRVAVG
jgi:hypothetical protein